MLQKFKHTWLFVLLAIVAGKMTAQNVYTINADSVKLTGCDSSELIIENHTQNIPGFLFNTGKGRTIFKKGAQRLTDSSYLIGGDTLTYWAHPWLQNGNAFGTTGVIGTLDDTHLDLYTHGGGRVRVTNGGNVLIGTTTDNGKILQVNGAASFASDLGVGVATIAANGKLFNTNALLFNHFIDEYHNFTGVDPHISKLDNILYNYASRFDTTTTIDGSGNVTIDMVIPSDELDNVGIVYPWGDMYFSFIGNVPGQVSVSLKDYLGTWHGPYSSSTNLAVPGNGLIQVTIPASLNYAVEIKIIVTPGASTGPLVPFNIEYVLDVLSQGLVNPFPFVGKYGNEHMYNSLYFKKKGSDSVIISPSGIGVGTVTPTAQFHTTGSVRLAGLTNDSTQTRILVSDANGNLYYRSASSLAANDIFRSFLAVNGPITARELHLPAHNWPDYVFDSSYHLLPLSELDKYIHIHNHLPGMIPASEVEGKGVEIGETQAALLRKVEELTLYSIEQDRKLESQDKELRSLRAEIDELKKLITIKK